MQKFTLFLKKLVSRLFSRVVLTGLLLVVQLLAFPLLLNVLAEYAVWLQAACLVLSVLMCLAVVRTDRTAPEFKIGWLLIFIIMPVPGGILYLLWGDKRPAFLLRRKLNRSGARLRPLLRQAPEPPARLAERNPRAAETARYVADYGPYPVFGHTESAFYPSGEAMYGDLLDALEHAQRFIFIEFFIIGQGEMWESVHEILKRKALQGVDVRVIYDDVGSVSVLPIRYWRKLEAEGIHSLPFNPFVPVLNLVMNNRDHRKIVVVDGVTAFSGGLNLADEYINRKERFGYWCDHGIRLKGDAAWSFTVMFLQVWNASRPTDAEFDRFRPQPQALEAVREDGLVQPFADSPLDHESVAVNVYLELINQAQHTLYITTPYLILSSDIQTALCLAAKRGVDVRIYTPGIPDKKMAFQLTRSYFPALIAAGVRIYSYTPGFLHAKTWLVDGRVGAVGSINLDYRSLYLHFECSTLLYGTSTLKDVAAAFEQIERDSRLLSLKDCRNGFLGSMLSAFLRLLAPLF
ncbi:MAG: cardiolipin synthase [Gemmiger sp.]